MLDSFVFVWLSFPLFFLSTLDAGRLFDGSGVAGKSPNEVSPLSSSPSAESLKVDKVFRQNLKFNILTHFQMCSPFPSYAPYTAPMPGYSRPCSWKCSLLLLWSSFLGFFSLNIFLFVEIFFQGLLLWKLFISKKFWVVKTCVKSQAEPRYICTWGPGMNWSRRTGALYTQLQPMLTVMFLNWVMMTECYQLN